jgi:predicted enzyme related to lactoylglutathione lyase
MRIRGYAAGTPCWVEVSSPDLLAAQAFYGGLFGWTAAVSPAGRTVFLLADRAVAGLRQAEPAAWLTHIATDDLATTAKLVADAGGRVLSPPAALGADGRSAQFADPAGSTFAAWQRGTFFGAQVNNEPGSVCWNELATCDIEGARTFYGRVFGWDDQPGEWHADHGSVGGIVMVDDRAPATVRALWTVCFLVSDCAATAMRAGELGGRLVAGPRAEPVGQVAQLADPHGAAFSAIEPMPEILATLL